MGSEWTIREAIRSWNNFRRYLWYQWNIYWKHYPHNIWCRIWQGWWPNESFTAWLLPYTVDQKDSSGGSMPPFASGPGALTDRQIVRTCRVLSRILDRTPIGTQPTATLCLAAVVRSASWKQDRSDRAVRAIELARCRLVRWPEIEFTGDGWYVGRQTYSP